MFAVALCLALYAFSSHGWRDEMDEMEDEGEDWSGDIFRADEADTQEPPASGGSGGAGNVRIFMFLFYKFPFHSERPGPKQWTGRSERGGEVRSPGQVFQGLRVRGEGPLHWHWGGQVRLSGLWSGAAL